MSILMPFRNDLKGRVKGRIPGNIIGGVVFLALYLLFSPSILPYIGMIGGVGVGLSASYKWQAVFNSLGAMAIATAILGLPGAILFRILNNILGSVYGQLFEKSAATFWIVSQLPLPAQKPEKRVQISQILRMVCTLFMFYFTDFLPEYHEPGSG